MRLELRRRGHRVSVFTGFAHPSDDDAHVHLVKHGLLGRAVRRLKKPAPAPEGEIFEWGKELADCIRAVHRQNPIDIIEMEESFGWSADVEQRTGIPVLVKLHGPAFMSLVDEELKQPFGQARIRREGQALAAATAIAAPSSRTLLQTLERYQLSPPIRQHVVNPLAMADDAPLWSLAGCNRNLLLFIGRFDRRKGGDIVLRAFERLLRERKDLEIVFVGPDVGLLQTDGRKIHFDEFCKEVFSDGQRARIDFRGRLENSVIPKLRVQAIVTIIASRWENQGYTALEAMFQGCPIVASDVGGNPECIIHGETGLLARSEDPEDFAGQIARLLDDPSAAAGMGAAARQHVLKNHAASKVASDSLILYEQVISQRRD